MSLKLKDLIVGLNIDEGLIKTYPIDASVGILNRNDAFSDIFVAVKFQSWILVEFKHSSVAWKDQKDAHMFEDYANIHEGEPYIHYLLKTLNALGYIPAFFSIFRSGVRINQYRFSYNKLRSSISDEAGTSYQVLFQPKYGEVLSSSEIPTILYHVSDSKNDERIKKIGLVPRSGERYDDRIYVVIDVSNITKSFVENIKHQKKCQLITMYEINSTGLNLVMYKDIEHIDRGFYIKKNIPPSRISVIKHV